MSLDIYIEIIKPTEVAWKNITHNLCPMWKKAGVYEALYESEGKLAVLYIDVVKTGLEHMKKHPRIYKRLNPKNGWGDYKGAVKWLGEWLEALKDHPDGTLRISA